MTLTELIAEVYTLTGRPDLVAETSAAVRKATLKMHGVDFFYRDLQEEVIAFATPAYKQQYDLQANIPNYRGIKYLREWSAAPTGKELMLDLIEPDAVLDEYLRERTNVYYVAGTSLNIKADRMLSTLVIGYYRRPETSTNLFSSWIALEQPFAIIEEAAANVFHMIGHESAKVTYQALARDQIVLLKQNYLEVQAR